MADSGADEIVDIAFRLPAGRLPIDHAHALLGAIDEALPWFGEESAARIHHVHTAATGSGWMRPDASPGEELHLSARTRLRLRVPERRSRDALALSGRRLDVGGYELRPGDGKVVRLSPADTLLARHVVRERQEDEAGFVARIECALGESGVHGAHLICGREQRITTPEAVLHTRSLVVTRLDPAGAMVLLRRGLGSDGKLGCGVFVPYKRIE